MPLAITLEFSHLVNLLSGLFIVIFASYKAFTGIFGNLGYFKEKKEQKKNLEKQEREKEYEKNMAEFSKKVLKPIIKKLEDENVKQNARLDQLIKSSNNVMRQEITKIYYKYLPYKQIPIHVKESMLHLFEDYTAQQGNSFIEDIVKEMQTWTVINSTDKPDQESK